MTVHVNDVIRVTAVLSGPGGVVENVYHFRCDLLVDTSESDVMQDLAQKLDDAYTHMVSGISSDYAFDDIQGFNVTQNSPMPTVGWPSLSAGTGSATSNAAGVSCLGIFRTGVARAIGRKFFGGIITANVDADGFWQSALVTAVAAVCAEFIGSFIGTHHLNTYLPGIISAAHGFLSFLETDVSGNPAYQRRRRFGRGI